MKQSTKVAVALVCFSVVPMMPMIYFIIALFGLDISDNVKNLIASTPFIFSSIVLAVSLISELLP